MPLRPFKVVIEPSTVIVFDHPVVEIPCALTGDIDPAYVTVKLSEPFTVWPPFVLEDVLDTVKSSAYKGADSTTSDEEIRNKYVDLMIISF